MTALSHCPIPGCPNLVEPLPNRQYCEDHDALNANLEPLYEDEARGALDQYYDVAKEEEARLGKEEHRFAHHTAAQVILHAPEVLAAAEAGAVWTAVRHALWVGLMAGHSQNLPHRAKLTRIEPDADRGRIVLEGAAKGGRMKRKAPSDDELIDAVQAVHERNAGLSWTRACELVGKQYDLSRRTVQNHARDADWR